MSATPNPSTPAVEATQGPSQIELLWERYRSLAYVLVGAVVAALGINYAIKYYAQKQTDSAWSSIATSIGIETSYTDQAKSQDSLTEQLGSVDLAKLKSSLATAPEGAKPYLMVAIARKMILENDLDGSEAILKEVESKYPNHTLVKSSPHPVQAQAFEKPEETPNQPPQQKPKPPKFKPAVSGSAVGLMRAQIAAARSYSPPAQFAKPEVPADAPKVKFEMGSYGSFVIALMPQAPQHRDAFLKLAKEGFWVGLAVDEIRRPGKNFTQPHEVHLGFTSTKDDDRTKWVDTEPSKNPLDFEANDLSHHAGAVSARNEADGKSCADRFWIAVDDAPKYDGDRVLFGFVVEGLENIKKVSEATMTAQEEEQGRGKPSETIRVTAVTLL